MKASSKMVKRILRLVLILSAFICMIIGLCLGHFRDNYSRASVICWECIGLGE